VSNTGLSEGVDKNCVSSNDTTEEEEGLEKLDSNQIIITSSNCIVENTVEKIFDQRKIFLPQRLFLFLIIIMIYSIIH